MIKMYLKIQDIFTRPNEFLPDMSGGQTEFREDWVIESFFDRKQFYCGVTKSDVKGISKNVNLFNGCITKSDVKGISQKCESFQWLHYKI